MMNAFRLGAVGCVAMGLVACASTPTSATAGFPAGRYASGDDVLISFSADGRMQGASRSTGEVWGRGRYRVEDGVLVVTDEWHAANMPSPECIEIPGRYRWTSTGTELKFTVIEDPCALRAEGMQAPAWTRVD